MTVQQQQGIKIYIEQSSGLETRRVPMPATLSEFKELLRNWGHGNEHRITYKDVDGDDVVVSSELEWGEVVRTRNQIPVTVTVRFPADEIIARTESLTWSQLCRTVPGVLGCLAHLRYFTSTPSGDYVDKGVLKCLMEAFGTSSLSGLCTDLTHLCDMGFVVIGATADTAVSHLSDRPNGSFLFRPSQTFPGRVAITRKSQNRKPSHYFASNESIKVLMCKIRNRASSIIRLMNC
eukprot:TRINITY_DN9527_c3_g1_i1.p1 TRINITY_DN9527_c3_g1~~TRINITY_DN9527_c3_g1_i1.p1  ORF type:complete len:235 (+),score=30.08 TRINITY_DN9527_c3_g1_i1:61-765(+)